MFIVAGGKQSHVNVVGTKTRLRGNVAASKKESQGTAATLTPICHPMSHFLPLSHNPNENIKQIHGNSNQFQRNAVQMAPWASDQFDPRRSLTSPCHLEKFTKFAAILKHFSREMLLPVFTLGPIYLLCLSSYPCHTTLMDNLTDPNLSYNLLFVKLLLLMRNHHFLDYQNHFHNFINIVSSYFQNLSISTPSKTLIIIITSPNLVADISNG